MQCTDNQVRVWGCCSPFRRAQRRSDERLHVDHVRDAPRCVWVQCYLLASTSASVHTTCVLSTLDGRNIHDFIHNVSIMSRWEPKRRFPKSEPARLSRLRTVLLPFVSGKSRPISPQPTDLFLKKTFPGSHIHAQNHVCHLTLGYFLFVGQGSAFE